MNECEHGHLARQCPLCEKDAEVARLQIDLHNATLAATQNKQLANEYFEDAKRLRAALLFLGKAFELEDDQTDSGFTYREALGHSAEAK